jgi:hypothetical protein
MVVSAVVLFLSILLLSLGTVRETPLAGRAVRVANAAETQRQDKRHDLAWYVRSGQWRADMRSVAAAIQYLSEPVTVAQTNGPVIKADDV